LATSGGSAALKASIRACWFFQSLSSSLIVVRLALPDLGVDQVDREVVWPAASGDKTGGGFAGTKTGIADAAHRAFDW